MEMFMYRLVRRGLWLGIIALTVITLVGCNTTSTRTETVAVAEEPSPPEGKAAVEATSSPSAEGAEVGQPARETDTGDPAVSRSDPFSEDNVKALEASLRPLEAIPTKTKATLPADG